MFHSLYICKEKVNPKTEDIIIYDNEIYVGIYYKPISYKFKDFDEKGMWKGTLVVECGFEGGFDVGRWFKW